jgi:maltose O-acetyltransferase
MKRLLAAPAALLVRLAARLALAARADGAARRRLGQLFRVARDSAHDLDVAEARRRYAIHPSVTWRHDTLFHGEGAISIGEGTYLGRDCFVVAAPSGARISIGRYCAISHSVHIRTADYRTDIPFEEAQKAPLQGSDVAIGDHVWIGAHVVITGGVTIGSNCVVGANSVVTHDVPPNTVVGGVPARPLHAREATAG